MADEDLDPANFPIDKPDIEPEEAMPEPDLESLEHDDSNEDSAPVGEADIDEPENMPEPDLTDEPENVPEVPAEPRVDEESPDMGRVSMRDPNFGPTPSDDTPEVPKVPSSVELPDMQVSSDDTFDAGEMPDLDTPIDAGAAFASVQPSIDAPELSPGNWRPPDPDMGEIEPDPGTLEPEGEAPAPAASTRPAVPTTKPNMPEPDQGGWRDAGGSPGADSATAASRDMPDSPFPIEPAGGGQAEVAGLLKDILAVLVEIREEIKELNQEMTGSE